MSLRDQYNNRFGISFEVFPPKRESDEVALFRNIERLGQFDPDYFTCTYGAGGSTQTKTLEIATRIRNECDIPVASHLTLVNSTVDDLRKYLSEAAENGIDYIVALRGDPPKGMDSFTKTEGGFSYASDLVKLINEEFPQFGVAVAGYPEKHQEAVSLEVDLEHLKHKVDCGADVVMTQLFYDNDDFYRFRDLCDQSGINVPIIPGILPVTKKSQLMNLVSRCNAKLPNALVESFDLVGEEDEFEIGVGFSIKQVQDLIENNVNGLHFYVLNRSKATSSVLREVRIPERTKN